MIVPILLSFPFQGTPNLWACKKERFGVPRNGKLRRSEQIPEEPKRAAKFVFLFLVLAFCFLVFAFWFLPFILCYGAGGEDSSCAQGPPELLR